MKKAERTALRRGLSRGGKMRPFDEWYDDILNRLDAPRTIRKWTYAGRYSGTEFTAQTYRNMTAEQRAQAWADPVHPEDLILPGAGRATFERVYPRWNDYRNGRINRADLGGPNTEVLSIFKEFESLMENER